MLTHDDLLSWFQRLAVPEETRTIIAHIRSSDPSRRVGGGHSNVSGRYPSRKMGVTIQFESHRVELAGIYEMEHDATVLEYFDQPPTIKLDYKSAAGKRMGVLHTPDFFVIREKDAGWEEWKTEETLKCLAKQNSNRYCTGPGGRWQCPPGVAYAERFGLYYRVRSSTEIDWTFQRNVQFLEDYLRGNSTAVSSAHRELLTAYTSAAPGVSLETLLRVTKGRIPPDDLFSMIATNLLHVDLRAAPLAEPSQVEVFVTSEEALRFGHARAQKPKSRSATILHCGSKINWDGRIWTVMNNGDTSFGLLSDDQRLSELPISVAETLLRKGLIKAAEPDDHYSDTTVRDRISAASEADLQIATRRAQVIRHYLDNGMVPGEPHVTVRTIFRWLAQYRQAEQRFGNGFLGLLSRQSERGNRTPKLPERSRKLMEEFINEDYESLKQKTRYASWIALRLSCENRGIVAPSYKTFCAAVRRRPAFDQVLKRKGRRASYQVEAFCWELDQKTPRHGDRPFEIVHIDHTELDIELISHAGQALGRPWMTLLTDAFSRRILGFYLTFDAPSYRSCMMVLRECVRRFNRFPQILVVDGGREFESTYFETLLAWYECTKKIRPPAKARFGSICERSFGSTNTQFIHNLRGNTQITRNVRQVTKTVAPKRLAVWSLTELHQRLTEFFYGVHETLNHPALGQSPRDAFQEGLVRSGPRLHRIVPYDQEFLMLTLPTTAKGTAKVSASRGMKINHVYYWCQAFRELGMQGATVPVRYDPFDAGIAYAFMRQQWLPCHSEYYAVLQGRSEREVMLATRELHQRHHNHSSAFTVTARQLAVFLQSVESEESLLTQRLCDRESKTTRFTLTNSPASNGYDSVQHQTEGQASQPATQPLEDLTIGEVYGGF